MTDISNMEDIAVLKAEIDSKLQKEMNNLSLLKDTLKKSNTNTENMLGILSTFETRLRKLENTIVPVYNETENLRRRQENVEGTLTMLDHVLAYYHVASEAQTMISDGPGLNGLDRYLSQMDRILAALNYFKQHNQNSIELREVASLFEQGKNCLQDEFQRLLARHGRPVPPIIILDLMNGDEELQSEDVTIEHLPEKVVEDLSDISRWLVTNGNSTGFLKDYITHRSSMLIKSLNGLKEHLKASSIGSGTGTLAAPHSPALTSKFRASKSTPSKKNVKGLAHYTRKASTALLKSPFDPGHRRTGSNAEIMKDDVCDVDIDVYITELTALLRLMQSELQLLCTIIPEKFQRAVYDNIVQPGLDAVVTEGETLAGFAKKNLNRHDLSSVLSIFPVVKHLRSIKPEFDRTLEGCQAPTRATLASLLSTLGSTGAKALEAFIFNIKNDPDKASNMPKDGTVHELTNHTIVFLEQLQLYAETAGAMLLMHGEHAAPSDAVDDRKSKLQLADYCSKVLAALGLNLSNKSETYGDPYLKPIFLLNNYNYILKSLKRSGCINLVSLWNKDIETQYEEQINEQKKFYSQSWSRVLHYILEMNEPMSTQRTLNPDAKLKDKERQNIKDKFTGFNKELEDILRAQKGYAIPDTELRAVMKKDNIEFILPAYKIFLEKYKKLNFTKNVEKYIKYTVADVEAMINKFFDTAA